MGLWLETDDTWSIQAELEFAKLKAWKLGDRL